MKGKREFTEDEANKIRILIKQKLVASTKDQKGIRDKIRDLQFYFSDFSDKKGYTVDDFNLLIKFGQIRIIGGSTQSINEKMKKPLMKTKNESKVTDQKIEKELIATENFRQYNDLDSKTLDKTGFYCLRLKKNSKLPDRYQNILDKRLYKYIYIGKAEGQTLRVRLGQEIEHKRPGTFFRSIGCVLRYSPIKGHLKGLSNQKNFKFSITDTAEIVNWLIFNVEISIVEYNSCFEVEKEFIQKYCPLLNDTYNPMKLQELKDDKDKCRKIARSI